MEDLKANTEYTGYTAASPVVQWFWDVVRSFSKEDMARLLQFITGTSKVLFTVCLPQLVSHSSRKLFVSYSFLCLWSTHNEIICRSLWRVSELCKASQAHKDSRFTKLMEHLNGFPLLTLGTLNSPFLSDSLIQSFVSDVSLYIYM